LTGGKQFVSLQPGSERRAKKRGEEAKSAASERKEKEPGSRVTEESLVVRPEPQTEGWHKTEAERALGGGAKKVL
jgi:hypothetical protein